VGSEFTLESDLSTNFYWTRAHGTEILTDAFTNRGIFVNLNLTRARADGSWDWGGGDKRVLLSTNGKVVLGIGWHARPGLTETLECFLATMEEPDPPLDYSTPAAGALTAPPLACGNGVVEAGEQCDDGNHNDADGCSARCQRPKLAARASGSCALGEDGSAACWGDTVSSLGVRRAQPWTPEAVPSLENANQLSLGNHHACAVLTSGRIECWGRGGAGQLGNGALLDSATPVEVNGITDAVHVSVRNESSCAVLGDGSVQCWGHAARVPSGTGALADSSVPVTIPGLDQVIQVAQLDHLCRNFECADFGACALRADSSVWCWGAVPSDEGPIDSTVPVRVLEGVRQIAAGEDHVCMLLEAGNARCWGTFHQHTDWKWEGGWMLTLPPDTIALAGGLSLACALASDGRVYCAGGDDWGGLGRGRRYAGHVVAVATPVSTITDAVHLAVGVSNACAALAGGTVSCWGVNNAGQVGLGSEDGTFPTAVPLAHRVRGLP
jgi:cysteine-rich repeat protein